jgi:hypothetical protein
MNSSHTAAHAYEFLIQTQSPIWIFRAKPITHMNCRSGRVWLLSYGCHETRKRETIRFGNIGLSVTLENQLQCYITVPWLGYGLNGSAFETRKGQQIQFFPKHPDRLWVPSSLPGEYRGSLPGVKRPGREVNHAPPMPRIRLDAAYGGTSLFFFFCYSTRDFDALLFLG